MHTKHFPRAMALGLASAALVAGCGGDDDSADVPSSPTAAVPTISTPGNVPTPEATKDGKGGKATPASTPDADATPEFTAAPGTPDAKATITVSTDGIEISPDPLPKNRRVQVTLKGGGFGKKASVIIYEGKRPIASARLTKRANKFETETISSDSVTVEVTGTDKVSNPKKTVEVR